ncbi:MAG: lamin tail domain-containing protein, partial [Actinomycetota bacterium]
MLRGPAVAVLVAMALVGTTGAPVAAAVGDVGSIVISEIMYHPAEDPSDDDVDNLEFIELHNPAATPASLDGFTWGDGVDGELDGVVIPGGGYVVVSPDPAATTAEYGVVAATSYRGKLANSGERVRLVGPDGTVVDEVDYDDKAP